jgi:hypothetical protein
VALYLADANAPAVAAGALVLRAAPQRSALARSRRALLFRALCVYRIAERRQFVKPRLCLPTWSEQSLCLLRRSGPHANNNPQLAFCCWASVKGLLRLAVYCRAGRGCPLSNRQAVSCAAAPVVTVVDGIVTFVPSLFLFPELLCNRRIDLTGCGVSFSNGELTTGTAGEQMIETVNGNCDDSDGEIYFITGAF